MTDGLKVSSRTESDRGLNVKQTDRVRQTERVRQPHRVGQTERVR